LCSYNKKNMGRAKHHSVDPERNPVQKGKIQNKEGKSGCTVDPHRSKKTEKNNSPMTLLYREMKGVKNYKQQMSNITCEFASSLKLMLDQYPKKYSRWILSIH